MVSVYVVGVQLMYLDTYISNDVKSLVYICKLIDKSSSVLSLLWGHYGQYHDIDFKSGEIRICDTSLYHPRLHLASDVPSFTIPQVTIENL